jgi:hypothetical protein
MHKTLAGVTSIVALTMWLSPAQAAAQVAGVGGAEQRVQVTKGTWKGQLVDSSCYKKMGAEALNPENLKCTLDAMKKGDAASYVGLLTDGDGIFKVVGDMAKGNFAKLTGYVGKKVEVTGTVSLPIGGWATREIEVEKIKITM